MTQSSKLSTLEISSMLHSHWKISSLPDHAKSLGLNIPQDSMRFHDFHQQTWDISMKLQQRRKRKQRRESLDGPHSEP